MLDEDRIGDLVVQWGQAWEQGRELSVDELCKGNPELKSEVADRIQSVKDMSWLNESDDEDDDLLSLPDFATVISDADETKIPAVTLSIEEFTQAVIDSGLMTSEEIEAIRQRSESKDTQELARLLLREKKLTTYQAKRICDGNTKGLVFGNYIILDEIGAGGMGQVFKARHQRMKRVVALKVLPEHAVNSPTALERFHREVEAAAKLEHPNIVTAYDADESDGTHFLVMQYVDGKDLATLVQRQGRLSVARALDCILQAAKGLEFAHGEGVVHRDIKPANLLIDKKGCVKVLDMGLALLETSNGNGSYAATQAHLTQDGTVMGTVDYMSPEQALDTHHADVRSDIYSLGCTLFYLLTGQPLHEGKTLMAKMLAHRETENPVLHEVRAGVPEELSTVFEKMVAKKPEDRYQSMTALLEELEAVAGDLVEEEVDSPSEPSPDSAVEMSSRETSSASLGDTIDLRPKIAPVKADTPQLAPQAASGRRNMFIGGIATVAVAIFAWLYFAGIIFKVETEDGLIVIDTNVPDVEVFVDGQKVVTITDPKDKGKVKVEVKPGAKMLTVSKEGFEAEVSSFTLKTVKGPIKVTFVPKSSPSGDADREVAEWVLQMGGSFFVSSPIMKDKGVLKKADLPQHEFYITSISLTGSNPPKKLSDAQAKQLRDLKHLSSLIFTENLHFSDHTLLAIRPLKIGELHLTGTAASDEWLRHIPSSLSSIYLDRTSIGDDGFKHLSQLPRLSQIQASNTKVTDVGIKHFVNHPLTYLNLSGCSGITNETLEVVKDWPEPYYLYLANTQITDAGLAYLRQPTLHTLDLTGTKVTASGVAELQKALPNCEIIFGDIDREVAEWVLGIGGTIRTDAGEFTDMGDLPEQSFQVTELFLQSNNKATDADLERLKGLTTLTKLQLSNTNVGDAGLQHLKELTTLTTLHLDSTRISNAGLVHLEGLTNLTGLYFQLTQVGDDGLVHLKGLTKLGRLLLYKTQVSDSGLQHLTGLTSLTDLRLVGTKVTESGVIALSKALPNCRIEWDGGVIDPTGNIHQQVAEWVLKAGGWLTVSDGDDQSKEVRKADDLPVGTFRVAGVDLTGNIELDKDGLKLLNQLDYLDYLAFDHNPHFSDSTLAQIPSLAMRDLRLSNVVVTDQGIQSLNLKKLWAIRISNTAIGDEGFKYLSTGPKFAQLDANNTAVTDKGVAALVNDPLHPMTHLSLNDCSITDDALQYLKDWTDLSGLHLANTQITDAGLILLTKVGGGIDVTGTKVTRAGVLALQKAHPSVAISSDWNSDPNRRAADWALACGGTVIAQFEVGTGFEYSRTLQTIDDIPDDQFHITGIAVNHPELNHGGLHNLDGLAGLRRLDLSGTQFDPHYLLNKAIQTLTALSVNDLQGDLDLNYSIKTLVDYTFERTGKYPNLTLLELRNTPIGNDGAESLKKLTNLRYLDVTGTKISPTVIKSLQEALPNCLVVSQFNTASKDPDHRATHWLLGMGGMVDIRTGWDGNTDPRGGDWRRFSSEQVSVNGKMEAGAGEVFEQPFALVGAHFRDQVPIFDADWQHFSGTKPWDIGLSGSPVTDEALEQIARLPIREISVSNTAITDEGLRHLSGAEHLQMLILYNCQNITNAGLEHLANTKLSYLRLDATGITDAALEHVARIKSLEILSLKGTNVSDAGIEPLSSLKNLRELQLGKTKLTAEGIEALKKALPNCKIIWDGDKDNQEDK